MDYDHTQTSPLFLFLAAFGIGFFVWGNQVDGQKLSITLFSIGAVWFLLALSFRQLTCRDEGAHLRISFGPLPIFRRKLLYSRLEKVKQNRSRLLDGWGIHLCMRGGWVWNLWGFDCVDIDFTGGKKLRLGTDDPEGLAAFLNSRTPESSAGKTDSTPL